MHGAVPPADERATNERPVARIVSARLELDGALLPVGVGTTAGTGLDLDQPHPTIAGVLVILHGRLRNAADYLQVGIDALPQTGSEWLVIAPQYLAAIDIQAHDLPDATLRWSLTGWMGGDRALDPAGDATGPSAFAVLDTLLARLRPGPTFPALQRVVLAGHSGGAQVVQRYAMLNGANTVRYVVANPSSYAYPWPERPEPVEDCPGYDSWKYGLADLPSHAPALSRDALVRRYASHDITYLVGSEDSDPLHPAMDRTCAALVQGPHRRARTEAFVAGLRARLPDCRHRFAVVSGVGHDAAGMFTSPEGARALFA